MTRELGDVCARARGLTTHLLRREDLERLARSPGLGALARGLEDHGYAMAGGDALPLQIAIDLALRRETQRRLALLARWLGPRRDAFAVVFEDEDRRTIRRLLRTVAQGLEAVERLAGLLPTPDLPEDRLRVLAERDGVDDLVSQLVRLGSPYGPPLADALQRPPASLYALEVALDRTFAERALRAAQRESAALRSFVSEEIDLQNAWMALLAGPAERARSGVEAFVLGGRLLSRAACAEIEAEQNTAVRRERIARAFARSPLGAAFAADAPASSLEALALAARIAAQRRATRVDPLGPAPILQYVLRLRAELQNLRRITWGLAVGAPPAELTREWVAAG